MFIDSLVPRDLGDSLDLSVEEERPCMLRGILGDLICEAGVVLDEYEAAVRVIFLPGAVKHLGLDLVMLGAGLAPRGVQGLVEILHKVGRLAQHKGHLAQVSSQPQHLLRIRGQPLELIRRAAPGRWWRPTQRNDGNLVAHHSVKVGLNHTRQQH